MEINQIIKYAELIKKTSKIMREYKEEDIFIHGVTEYFEDYDDSIFYQMKNVQLFILKNEKQTVFIFPESYGKKDWKDNFNFLKTKGYHRGFLAQYRKVQEFIIKNIELEKENIILGWSLGGALTSILASKWYGYDMKFCTFGQPRAMSHNLAGRTDKWHKKNYIRVVNPNDPVTKVPFKLFIPTSWFFWHVGTKLKVGKNKFWLKVLKFWKWKSWRHDEQMNHHIDGYIDLLKKI